jgi:hypothetical protein
MCVNEVICPQFFLSEVMGRVVHGASCPWGELSMGRVVHGASCLWGELSWGELSWGEWSGNLFRAPPMLIFHLLL